MQTPPYFRLLDDVIVRNFCSVNDNCIQRSNALPRIIWRDGAREEMLGDKIVKVPTASEKSKIFTDHTFLIGSKVDKAL